jgi:hypothetical protein
MKLSTRLVLVAVGSAVFLTACGGGKVTVNTPSTPGPTVVAANTPAPSAPAPSAVVVTTVPATPAPPPSVAVLGPSPGPDYVRVEGYYNWLGDHYEWVSPTWVRVPRAGATFVPGHWQSTAGGYMWTPGYWQ